MKNLIYSLCSCVIPKTENITLKIEYTTDNCVNQTNFLKYQSNSKFIEKHFASSINPLNNLNDNNKYNNCINSNLKLDIPYNNSFNSIHLSNISNSGQMSPCISSINSYNSQKYKKLISKHQMSKRLINENDIFKHFQDNVDNIINEIKQKKTISESDDSEMCFSK